MEAVARKFERVNNTIHGDGKRVILQVVNTCEQMLRDRGYEDVQTTDLEHALNDSLPVLQGERAAESDRRVSVYLCDEEKVGVKYVRSILQRHSNDASHLVVLVSVGGPTAFTRRECDGKPIQFLIAKDLCYNVTRHKLVPHHRAVPSPPNGVEKDKLPRILDTDPIVQYYNWPVGTIVEVSRCYAGHEPIPYFRCVSAASS